MHDTSQTPIYTDDPDLYQEMMSSPNSPSHERYTAAAQAYHAWDHQNNLNAEQDLANHVEGLPSEHKPFHQFTDLDHYSDIVAAEYLTEETSAEFQMDVDAEPDTALFLAMYGARQGCTHSTIGLARCSFEQSSEGPQTLVAFGRTSRHPDWMAMSPLLHNIFEMTAFIFQEPGSSAPSFVLFTDKVPETPAIHQHYHPCPEGQATILKDLLRYLGAIPVWVQWNGDYDHHPDIPIETPAIAAPAYHLPDPGITSASPTSAA